MIKFKNLLNESQDLPFIKKYPNVTRFINISRKSYTSHNFGPIKNNFMIPKKWSSFNFNELEKLISQLTDRELNKLFVDNLDNIVYNKLFNKIGDANIQKILDFGDKLDLEHSENYETSYKEYLEDLGFDSEDPNTKELFK